MIGFYVMGSFEKGKKSIIHFDRTKPFEIDSKRGIVSSKVFRFWKRNIWFDEWEFIEDKNSKDLNTDKELREYVEEIWKMWCEKHKRKYTPVFTDTVVKEDAKN